MQCRLLGKKEEWGLIWKWREAGDKRCKDITGGLIMRRTVPLESYRTCPEPAQPEQVAGP